MAVSQSQHGRLLEPGLRKIFFDNFNGIEDQYTKLFNVETSKKAIETEYRMAGFGLWEKKDSMGNTKYEDIPEGIANQYIHEEFSKGFQVERKMIDDEQYGQIKKLPKNLARVGKLTVEQKAAEVFNRAFDPTYTGYDKKPLIASDHPLLGGGTTSNLLLASTETGSPINSALTDAGLKAALTQMRKQVDEKGNLIAVRPNILVVPPELEFTARTILESANLSATGKGGNVTNDKNVIKDRLELVVYDYLTDPKAWFLLDSNVHELNFFWRVKPEFKSETNFDNDIYKYKGYMRFSCGWSDYRGILGSKGTNS